MNSIRLKLITNFSIRYINLNSSDSIFNIKEAVAQYDDIDPKRSNVLLVRTSELLEDENSLKFYKLQNEDEIFVTNPPRYSLSSDSLDNSSKENITQKDIDEATKYLEPKNNYIKKINHREPIELLQKKVYITLIEIAQNILCLNKTTSDLFEFVHKEINRQSVNEWEFVQRDINAISKLIEMGFSRERAENAWIQSNNSFDSALRIMLTQYENDEHGASLNNDKSKLNQDANIEIQWLRDTRDQLFIKPMKGSVILHLYREYIKKTFGSGSVEQDEILEGLPHDSLIMKTILSNPEIQLGLLNVKSLFAFLKIVDNPNSLSYLIEKPETKLILEEITIIIKKCETDDALLN